ncbi:hypothetical protein HPB50_005014 [Hyalomma asiaticum]|uniref:Uncharacterized protein n=1 Tax=Hyalomma asiaticum TaxID=266040 RepID=A0ACB7SMX4_HYAAI|nr:hypothetical protein HPB50_005014 [Hyalomma asiaticum]
MSFKAGKWGVGVVLLTASVEASQQLSKTYRPWCIVKDDGTVVSAHCMCIAGLGECCSHVAALLFNIEAAIKYGLNDPSPTEAACRWSKVSKSSTTFAPNTLVLSCTTDSEGTDSSPETAAEERKATKQHCSSLSAMGDIYGNADLHSARNAQLSKECCAEIQPTPPITDKAPPGKT